MIKLTHFASGQFYLNCDLIEQIEELPDTVVTMTNGKKLIVGESAQEIIDKIIQYRAEILIQYKKCTEIEV